MQNIVSFIGLFCKKRPIILRSLLIEATPYGKIDLWEKRPFANETYNKETYNFIDPTNQSHPIVVRDCIVSRHTPILRRIHAQDGTSQWMNTSCHTSEYITQHIGVRHVTHMGTSRHTYENVMSLKMSRHTYAYVMSHTSTRHGAH